MSSEDTRRPFIARTVRSFGPLIIVAWLALTVLATLASVGWSWKSAIPALEHVAEKNSVSLIPSDAPAGIAMKRMGHLFKESDSDSSAMIVLEGQQPLGDDARAYYARLIQDLRNDPQHIEHVQDLWGDRLTSSSVQSPDGKAAYVQVNLAGNQGTPQGEASVAALRAIVERIPPPPGVRAYVAGQAPLASDLQRSGNNSILKITAVSVVVIFTMLMFVYRSVVTVLLLLIMVGVELAAARGIVAFLGANNILVLSTFAVNMLIFLAIAAGTDYGIFFFGRYQEARQKGQDREDAYYEMYRGVTPVVAASGLTIAGAIFCLHFTRLPYFHTMGAPCAIGMVAAVAVAVTLVPAGVAVASRFGLLEPKRTLNAGRWRGIGTAIVRWPVPILVASLAVALVGLLALPGYKASYNDRAYILGTIPAKVGFAAAERHFSQSRLLPDIVMVESDHDLRNPTDFITLNKIAKAIFRVPGVSRVQGITRPEGTPIAHTSLPFQISLQTAGQDQILHFMRRRAADMLQQANDMAKMIKIQQRMYELMSQMAAITHRLNLKTHEMYDITTDLRDWIALFDDWFRPIRNYFYWEPHCYSIPVCWALRSIFDALDGTDELTDRTKELLVYVDRLDVLMPQMVALMPEQIAISQRMRMMMLTQHSTMVGILGEETGAINTATLMAQAYDDAKNDDTFYLPPEVFDNADFKRAMNSFISPDGKSARFIISHIGDPATKEGIARIEQVKTAAEEALKGTPLAAAKVWVAGAAATAKDWRDGSTYDLWIAGVAALCLIFVIMLIITRSLIAALVIVGTVALSLGASFGLSVLLWQYILGIQLHWMVLAMSVIVLLAVGSDYNLLLVSRMKEEIGAGINTGLIRAMGGTGKVVTTAGLVFAATMASMVVSDLRIIGQIGTTIGLGLLFDTVIVRSFMTPSIAAVFGRWFWWPQRVRPRPASFMLRPYGTRMQVRELLEGPDRRQREPATEEVSEPV